MAQSFPTLDVAGQTDVGLKRSRNEDSFTVMMPPAGSPQLGQGALFLVADGMGGMGGGDVASKTAIEEIVKHFYDPSVTHDYDPLPRLRAALEAANVRVRETAQTVGLPRIGATGAGLIVTGTGDAVVFNVGDSRVYRVRGNYIELLTRDQSVMATQLESGMVSQEEAKLSRNVNVTSFIGQPMPISPVYSRMQTQQGDVFIICSDGLWDLVEPNEILKAVQSPSKEAARKLIELVRQRGAPDNVTVIIVRVGKASRPLPVGAIAAAVLIVLAGVAGFALARGGLFAAEPTPTTAPPTQAVVIAPPSATATAEATEAPQASAEVISIRIGTSAPTEVTEIPAATEAETAAVTAALVADAPTETATATASATKAATATSTPTASATVTATETATTTPSATATPTSTRAVTRTPTPTETEPPTRTPLPTPIPSATPQPEPTVTLNPAVVSPTPAQQPTPQAQPAGAAGMTRKQFMVMAAERDGIILNGSTTLYILEGDATQEATSEPYSTAEATASADLGIVLAQADPTAETTAEMTATVEITAEAEITLDAGTHIHLLNDRAPLVTPGVDDLLMHVTVTSGDHAGQVGWIRFSALLDGTPAVPYVVPNSSAIQGVNIRNREGPLSPVVDALPVGQYARLVGISSSPLGWYLVEIGTGRGGWLSPQFVTVEGDKSDVRRVKPPPTPTLTPTKTETPTPIPLPTLTAFP